MNDAMQLFCRCAADINKTLHRGLFSALASANMSELAAAKERYSAPSSYIANALNQFDEMANPQCFAATEKAANSVAVADHDQYGHRAILVKLQSDLYKTAVQVLEQNSPHPAESEKSGRRVTAALGILRKHHFISLNMARNYGHET